MRAERIRALVERRLAALEADDLEERLAPVKCLKHPDHPSCGGEDYASPVYGMWPTPDSDRPGGEEGSE